MSIARHLILVLLIAALTTATPVRAANGEPLPPREAYRYAVSDVGDALEIDWSIEDGYYLYKNKLGFASRTGALILGTPVLPQGLEHEDEFFGRQEIYRERFYARVPYTIIGVRPPSIELEIRSQGCADIGLCYPPQVWVEEIALDAARLDKPLIDLSGLGRSGSDEFLPVDEAFRPALFPIDGNTIEVSWQVAPGYYLYKDKIKVTTTSGAVQLGRLELPPGKLKFDEFFGESEVYLEDAFARLPLARATPDAMDLELMLDYQGCAEAGLCYPPTTRTLTVRLPEAATVGTLAATDPPLSEQGRLAKLITGSSLWAVIVTFFGIGLLLALTPCVLPMVPILSSIIAGEGKDTTPVRGFVLALSYVLGMSIVYTAAGVVAVAAGLQVQAAFNAPWVVTLFAGLFVVLAVAMFGGYDVQMPSAIQTRLASISGAQQRGTTVGAFIMGALSALIVTACVAPALVAALAVMAQTGDMLRGGISLFAMSLGMGAPLLLVGAAQGHLLPKAGAWMTTIKVGFGFMLLGLAVWMLSRILPDGVTVTLWGVLIFMVGVFLGGLTTIGTESTSAQKIGKGFGVLFLLYGIVLLVGALAGGTSVIRPLAGLGPGGSQGNLAEAHGLEFKRIKTVADFERELDAASVAGRTVMLDFYADWCVSCKEMEAFTFTNPQVQSVLADTVLLQADVTANDEDDQALLERFGVFGPPTIIFFGADGRQRDGYEVVGYMKAEKFADHVQRAFATDPTVTARQD